MLIQYVLILLAWLLVFPVLLILCLIWYEHIGIYHVLESSDSPDGEPFHSKFYSVLEYNLYLSMLIAMSIGLTIKTSVDTKAPLESTAFIAVSVGLVVVLVERILANPCVMTTNFIYKNCQLISEKDVAKRCKLYILPFFYAFVGVALLLFLLLYSYKLLTNGGFTSDSSHMLHGNILAMMAIYPLSLFNITLIGEIILYFFRPVDCIPYKNGMNKI